MTEKEITVLIEEMKRGKIFYTQDRTYAYGGDILAHVVRYDHSKQTLLLEIYDLTPNGDFCSRSDEIKNSELAFYAEAKSLEEALQKLKDQKLYKFIK